MRDFASQADERCSKHKMTANLPSGCVLEPKVLELVYKVNGFGTNG